MKIERVVISCDEIKEEDCKICDKIEEEIGTVLLRYNNKSEIDWET